MSESFDEQYYAMSSSNNNNQIDEISKLKEINKKLTEKIRNHVQNEKIRLSQMTKLEEKVERKNQKIRLLYKMNQELQIKVYELQE